MRWGITEWLFLGGEWVSAAASCCPSHRDRGVSRRLLCQSWVGGLCGLRVFRHEFFLQDQGPSSWRSLCWHGWRTCWSPRRVQSSSSRRLPESRAELGIGIAVVRQSRRRWLSQISGKVLSGAATQWISGTAWSLGERLCQVWTWTSSSFRLQRGQFSS